MVYFGYLISLGLFLNFEVVVDSELNFETWTFLFCRNRFSFYFSNSQREINEIGNFFTSSQNKAVEEKKTERNNKLVVEKLKAFFIAMTTVEMD